MRKRRIVLAALTFWSGATLGVPLSPSPAEAQLIPGVPVTLELRPSVSVPVGGMADTNPGLGAETGFGLVGTARVAVTSTLGAYAGYGYGRFGCGQCAGVGLDDGLDEAGFEAGIRAVVPYAVAGLDPWVEAGALLGRKLAISGPGGDLVSDAALGWSAGGGVTVPVGAAFGLSPGIRYRSYSAGFVLPDLGFDLYGETGDFERDVRVSSLSLELGLTYGF